MFVNKQVYKGTFDSTFVIVYSQPQHQAFYFTPDKRLVKVEIPGQQLKAYLDIVRVFDVGAPEETGHALGGFVARLPVFTAYLILGLFSLVFFAGRAYRRPVTWLAAGHRDSDATADVPRRTSAHSRHCRRRFALFLGYLPGSDRRSHPSDSQSCCDTAVWNYGKTTH
jgi:hypothetical protein